MPQRKTPKEIAASTNEVEKSEWILTASIAELNQFVHDVPTHNFGTEYQRARTALDVRISEAQVRSVDRVEASSLRLEASSQRMERHTVWLKYYTLALVVLTFVLILLTYILVQVEDP